jgi:hypothetical protein
LIKLPAFILNVPLTVEAVPKLTPPAMSTSLKAIVPETVPVPAKLTFEVPAVKVPLFVNDPLFAIVIVGVPDVLKVAPELMVNEFKLTFEEITPEFAVPDRMVTFVEDVGTPPHQFAEFDQSVEVPPIQVPKEFNVAVTANREVLSQPFTVWEA